MNDSSIEIRSLQIGKWGNLVMAIAGVVTAYLSRSDAILVDGLFSGVNFASAIIAARVGAIVLLPPDREHPWGIPFKLSFLLRQQFLSADMLVTSGAFCFWFLGASR